MPATRRKPMSLPMILGLAAAVGVSAIMFVLVASYVVYKSSSRSAVAAQADPATKVYTREEFKALVDGKTPEEVIAAVGRPATTHDRSNGMPGDWVYFQRVMNPNTGKPDFGLVEFQDGKVIGVKW